MYAAMISAVDDGVGEVRGLLQELRLDRDTLVLFTADNGATTEPRAGLAGKPATAGYNRGFKGFKFSLFDGGTHVPAVMSWPGQIPAGRTTSQIAAHYDFAPTMLAAAGLPAMPGDHFDGVNIWPAISKAEVIERRPLHWQNAKQLAIRKGQWKLTLNGYTADGTPNGRKSIEGEDAVFLANLEQDPGESRNLRRAHPDITTDLEAELKTWLEAIQKLAPKSD